MKQEQNNIIEIKNKKAEYQYFLLSQLVAGIVLTGTEIKSIREGKANLNDAYCTFINNELFVTNMHITEYTFGTYSNHNPKRNRKLLLNKRELRKFKAQVDEKGLTIIPVMLFINEKGLAKLTIAMAKGKKLYDKRESLKEKEYQRSKKEKSTYDGDL
ncbi:MAG: SsrA-binding protein SmpB [Bacteroidales bacterium]|jgi:SsrA-binding protein|nr:SsrA-binding protein SmpB [Bacteroidales bacterium]MBR0123569.1 SsrA-binding protein SmpB [Bacteroidales bacterium]MBR5719872.1 SsrA-binding protein SmpB [Bacteroidales bacterium]